MKYAAQKRYYNTDKGRATQARYNASPKAKYTQQKSHAKSRGIEFLLTFEEWWSYWTGVFHLRGKAPGQLCMSRYNDEGAYEVGNVSIKFHSENVAEARNREALQHAALP